VPEWFVLNVADAPALGNEVCGAWAAFEDPEAPFPDFGINVHVLQPGQPNAKYHSESVQEDFLVLSGECVAIIEGEERPLRAWDLVHCPAGTEHVFVGAGDRPCAILMVGAPRRNGALPGERTGGRPRRVRPGAYVVVRGGLLGLERRPQANAARMAARLRRR
jgi:mannose-6-phosphate isomerase-like protein (cupin superfamily)